MDIHNCRGSYILNSLRPRPTRRHFADDIFKRIFENENEWISPRISLKFVPGVRINNNPALVQIMAWRRPGDKPLSEPMMISLLMHICATRPQWVKLNCGCPIIELWIYAFIIKLWIGIIIHHYTYPWLSIIMDTHNWSQQNTWKLLIRCLFWCLIGNIIPSFWIAYQKLRIMDLLQCDTMNNGVKKIRSHWSKFD